MIISLIICSVETCLVPGDCTNGTVCTKGERGKSFCECPPNFRGEMCEISILCEKLESTCQAMGAVCVLKDSNAYCGCPGGEKMNFKLGLCENICNPDKCLHGKCEIIGENYKCSCDEGYTGSRCEEKIKYKTEIQT
ncbi:UNVERIFIED_CONTAM: eat-20 [Trichonephila clavipes]